MSKAKELAEKAYPEGDTYIFGDASIACQVAYVKGYHQAEKDLELSWEDISKIISIDQQVCGTMGISHYTYYHQQAMEEVLNRFKDYKK